MSLDSDCSQNATGAIGGFSGDLIAMAGRIRIGNVMTPRDRLVCVTPHATAGDALRRMGTAFDQLPVLTGEAPGRVSLTDDAWRTS